MLCNCASYSTAASWAVALIGLGLGLSGCSMPHAVPADVPSGTRIDQQGLEASHAALVADLTSGAPATIANSGLVGAIGGARIKFINSGPQELILPLPQRADGQVPLSFFIRSTPRDAAIEYRIEQRARIETTSSP